MEFLREYAEGRMTRELASEFLQMLGLSEDRALRMLDKVKQGRQSVDDAAEEVDARDDSEEPVVNESASVSKAFGQPIESGLPYIVIPMPPAVQTVVDEWRAQLLGMRPAAERPSQPEDPAHVTVLGPILGTRSVVQELARPVCEAALPLELRLGKVKILRKETKDVVTLEVLSPGLYQLNHKLVKTIPTPIVWHGFNAHMTICFVEKGAYAELDGLELGGLTGGVLLVSRMTFGSRTDPIVEFVARAGLVGVGPTPLPEPAAGTEPSVKAPDSVTKAATSLPAQTTGDSTSGTADAATKPAEKPPAKRKTLGMSTTSGEAGAFAQAGARFGVATEDEEDDDAETENWKSMMKLWE